MLLGVIADDFTGASDIANAISRGMAGNDGLTTTIYLGVPEGANTEAVDAGVVALKSRAMPASHAVGESLRALEWLLSQGAGQIFFKYCSTFDSTPNGNIGPVAEALGDALGVKGIVACPAFPENGRTVYQGHLFVHDRLLNESGMENHPINPMTDPDIRRWLRAQTQAPVGHVPLHTVRKGPAAVTRALDECAESGNALVIADAVEDDDLVILGDALKRLPLVTGGSAIAAALPRNFPASARRSEAGRATEAVDGPGVVLAGSCSNATRMQIENHAGKHPSIAIDVAAVMEGRFAASELFAWLGQYRGQSPLAYSSDGPDSVSRLQKRYGVEKIAARLDDLFGSTAVMLRQVGFERIVVAGGETSGAVIDALAPSQLAVGREIDPGVPALYSPDANDAYAIALKSGNFGAPDFFEKALAVMAGQ
ncbi:MAG: four-carbon acid sugar kinase family protein [Gammaproteobacteria bacterium]|nr:four-carbon acid sugar kinase family protein [Gammaproteobacteria bacterium]